MNESSDRTRDGSHDAPEETIDRLRRENDRLRRRLDERDRERRRIVERYETLLDAAREHDDYADGKRERSPSEADDRRSPATAVRSAVERALARLRGR